MVSICQTARRHIAEEHNLYTHRIENIIYFLLFYFVLTTNNNLSFYVVRTVNFGMKLYRVFNLKVDR
jgi:hypothetical protein